MPFTRRSALVAFTACVATTAVPVLAQGTGHTLRIGVIGAGSLGGAVGGNWVKAGHEVCFSSRHPEELSGMVGSLGPKASAGSVHDAAAFGSVVLLATPYDALPDLGRDLQDVWRGKIVLDATNPSLYGVGQLTREAKSSGVGITSAQYLPGVRLVRAFNAVDASLIAASASRTSDKVAVPMASDDAEALRLAGTLVIDAGCVPLAIGDLRASNSFQQGAPGFRANTTLPELRLLLKLPQG